MGDDRIDGPTTRAATRPQAVAARLNRRLRLSPTRSYTGSARPAPDVGADLKGDLFYGDCEECGVEWAVTGAGLDDESADWLRALTAAGACRDDAVRRLHERLLRVVRHAMHRRKSRIAGTELDDIAHQAAADATMAVLAKLATFRGESRFTTWAYKFVILEVSNKIGRHYWRNPPVSLQDEDWDRLPDRFGIDPSRHAEAAELAAAIRRAVDTTLTERQRRLFVGHRARRGAARRARHQARREPQRDLQDPLRRPT